MKGGQSRVARSGAPDETRYLAISRDLARDIFRGKYPVGSLLPPETSLSEAYGASRQTIREAMRIIGGMGLIARQRGVGTTVLAATPLPAFTQSVASLAELQHLGISSSPEDLTFLDEFLKARNSARFVASDVPYLSAGAVLVQSNLFGGHELDCLSGAPQASRTVSLAPVCGLILGAGDRPGTCNAQARAQARSP